MNLYTLYIRDTQNNKVETKPLKHFLTALPQYGANESGINRVASQQPRYIRITDIDENGVLKEGLGATAVVVEEHYLLENNDLLIARSGNTVGKSYLHKANDVDYPCFFAGYMLRFKIDELMVSPDYLFYFTQTSIYKKWVNAIQRPTGQPNINAEEYRTLPVPIPTNEIQEVVVERMKLAYKVKQEYERQAQALLDGIDAHLLEELGVTLPPEPENTLANRIFRTTWRQVMGGRLDPSYQRVILNFKSIKYPTRPLREVAFINPLTRFKGLSEDEEVSFVPMEAVGEDGSIDLSNTRQLSQSKGYTTFKENDLLVAKITPCMENGKTGVARKLKNGVGFGSTEFHVIREKTGEAKVDFLHHFFRTNFFRANSKFTFGGSAGHQRVPPEYFKGLAIPVPSTEHQEAIVKEIERRRNQAQTLRQQARHDFEQTKREIERLILGET